jgi:hypothetical protein
MIWLALLGCGSDPVLPRKTWTLRGEGVLGQLTGKGGCHVGLWGPTWGTPGTASVPCSAEPSDDGIWIRFPFETASSEGEASLRVALEARSALLPLGTRDDEHQLELRLEPGAVAGGELTAHAAATATALETWRVAWQAGSFRIQSADQLVGEVQFRAGQPAQVGFYDVGWMTDGVVEALQLDEGADLVLVFDAEPSLTGDPSVLRVNRPTNGAVVPLGVTPSPAELTYRLVPGAVTPEQRAEAQALATMAAGQRELSVGLMLVAALGEQANDVFFRAEGDDCPSVGELEGEWEVLLVGYELLIERVPLGCAVRVEPTRVQHGRRLAAQIGPDGRVVESVLRGL